MLDFIIKYWMELLFTIITSSTIYIFKEHKGLKSGLKALLRNEIIRIYENYSILGYCPNYMKENVNEIYNNYKLLGGNGYASNIIDKIYDLPNELRESE